MCMFIVVIVISIISTIIIISSSSSNICIYIYICIHMFAHCYYCYYCYYYYYCYRGVRRPLPPAPRAAPPGHFYSKYNILIIIEYTSINHYVLLVHVKLTHIT